MSRPSKLGLEPVNRMAYYGIPGPQGLPKAKWWTRSMPVSARRWKIPAVRKRIEDTGST